MSTTTSEHLNADPAELAKFSDIAHRWWDKNSEFQAAAPDQPLAAGLD